MRANVVTVSPGFRSWLAFWGLRRNIVPGHSQGVAATLPTWPWPSTPEAEPRVTKTGTVLSPEIEEDLADEAEAGYDLEVDAQRRVGRPSLGRGVSP